MTTVIAEPKPASRMTLANVRRGRIQRPLRVLAYGPDGVGKSTFASQAPNPIFLCAESGTEELDVARLPEPTSLNEVHEAIRMLLTEDHGFQTFIVDTVDWLEPLVFRHLVDQHNNTPRNKKITSIEEVGGGFQKGYFLALTEWRRVIAGLEALSTRREMNIILLAHAVVREFKNPEGDDFERWTIKLWESKNANTPALFREWADLVLFANYEILTAEVGPDKRKRVKGIGADGARFLNTRWTPMYDAKTRYSIPDQLPLSWDELVQAIKDERPVDPSKAREAIEALIPRLPGANQERAREALTKVGEDSTKLAVLLSRIQADVETNGADR